MHVRPCPRRDAWWCRSGEGVPESPTSTPPSASTHPPLHGGSTAAFPYDRPKLSTHASCKTPRRGCSGAAAGGYECEPFPVVALSTSSSNGAVQVLRNWLNAHGEHSSTSQAWAAATRPLASRPYGTVPLGIAVPLERYSRLGLAQAVR